MAAPSNRQNQRPFHTKRHRALFLDTAPGTLSVWRCTGRYNLPFVKIGRKVRYRRTDLVAWLEKRTRETGATA
ncbi:helix-turn-helix domain-containing protein [Candidatus Accumulibacter sp. ACC012]|uniref:helix-turn-helix domain-containing protein n=1 Tax=Candidatus Accumulibacter sp. ACC012 TaxID=2823332 RepID=UPI0034204889